MLCPIKVINIELTQPLASLANLAGYQAVQALVRWQGVPIGVVQVPVCNGRCEAATLKQAILEQHHAAILRQLVLNGLLNNTIGGSIADLLKTVSKPKPLPSQLPSVTVAVCTRDRPADLARCLEALCQLTRLSNLSLELLVIDNAPSSDATQKLVQQYPQVRYVQEPRPGLNWARNRAILEATSEIIAYTDDDVIVDRDWVVALAQVFAENPAVMTVTGLVMPHELETEAQIWFEQNGGFGKGFQQQWWRFPAGQGMHWTDLGTGNLGTGANMAFRRSVFQSVGYFDPALDVGTATHGAGDLELFFRILKTGHAFVYEPRALVWHRHRRDYARLRTQLQNNGSVFAFFVRSVLAYPETALGFLRLGLSWLWSGHLRPLLTALSYPARFPRDLRVAQLWGCWLGLTSYFKAKRQMAAIVAHWGDLPALPISVAPPSEMYSIANLSTNAIAVRTIELSQPLTPLTDVVHCQQTRLFITWKGSAIGTVNIANAYEPISVMRLSEAIGQLDWKLLSLARTATEANVQEAVVRAESIAALSEFLQVAELESAEPEPARLSSEIAVSILVATYDRPDDLRNCLTHLTAQAAPRPLEVIVIDNHPASGLTPPVVADFPTVKLISEARQGVAYARNAGIAASRGEIIVTVDDDVSMPPNWLETLLAPFARADVMAVTGNVLPVELETNAQQLFEQYGNGGLGRGFDCFEANSNWFERSWMYAVPTWELGGTANSAYRACIFSDPTIGLMDEALGPGMPSGVGEDIYLFYKILKAGGTIRYEATASVWHKHRRDLPALKRQLYNYSKGFVSYQLTTLLRDQDFRALVTLLIFLPLYHLKQLLQWLRGDRFYPLSLRLLEIAGNLAGAWSLWRSRQIVRRQGRSVPYVPVAQRPAELSIYAHAQLGQPAAETYVLKSIPDDASVF